MKSIIRATIVLVILLFTVTGCSKGSSNPVEPDNTGPPTLRLPSGRNLIGVWEIHLRSDKSGADVRINRTIQAHVNIVDDPGFEVTVGYQKPNAEGINDYNPYFGFRGWAIWNLDITLTNETGIDLYDVRGIIKTNTEMLGLQNAEEDEAGLTTLWGNSPFPPFDLNPFMSYEDLDDQESDDREFQVRFILPPDLELDCSDCSWPNAISEGNWYPEFPEFYIPQDAWINFAVDASTEEPCKEPYQIIFEQDEMETTSGAVAVSAKVFTHLLDPEGIDSVKLQMSDVPVPGYTAYQEITMLPIPQTPPFPPEQTTWGAVLTVAEAIPPHEGIYRARIIAKSTLPDDNDAFPINNPNKMYKDVRILVGDMEEMLNLLFLPFDSEAIIGNVLLEWTSREDDIYPPAPVDDSWFDIVESYEDDAHYLLIKYKVGDIDEYGVLRIPLGIPQNPLPLMVFCHWGRHVCNPGAKNEDGFWFYDPAYKNEFVELIPKYRGNALCWDKSEFASYDDEINSPADYDVDDVLAFLNVVINHEEDIAEKIGYYTGDPEPEQGTLLDTEKVGIMGGSPTYIAKIRDSYYGKNQIDRALVTIGSVTDFSLLEIKESCDVYIDNDGYVPEFVHHYFFEDYNFFKYVLEPYLQGEMTFNDARKRMFGASPLYFAEEYLTNVQAHHGLDDQLARPAHTEALRDLLGFLGNITEFHTYKGQGHGILPFAESEESTNFYKDEIKDWLDLI